MYVRIYININIHTCQLVIFTNDVSAPLLCRRIFREQFVLHGVPFSRSALRVRLEALNFLLQQPHLGLARLALVL